MGPLWNTLPALGLARTCRARTCSPPGSPGLPGTCRAANTIISSSVQSISSSSRSHRACSYSCVSLTGSVWSGGRGRLGWPGVNCPEHPLQPAPARLGPQSCLCAVQAHLVAAQPQSQPPSLPAPSAQASGSSFPLNLFVQILSICLLRALHAAEWTRGTE